MRQIFKQSCIVCNNRTFRVGFEYKSKKAVKKMKDPCEIWFTCSKCGSISGFSVKNI